MNRIEAAVETAQGYAVPEAAAVLIEAATEGPNEETRVRALESLLRLDGLFFAFHPRTGTLRRLYPEPAPAVSVDEFAAAVGALAARLIRSGDRRERQRLAPLISAVLAEAACIGREAEQEAAA